MANPKKPRYESFTIRWGRNFFNEKLTESGRAVFWLLLLANGLGGASFQMRVFTLGCCLAAVALISVVGAFLARRRLDVIWRPPSRATCARSFDLPVRVSNPGKKRALDVVVRPIPLPAGLRPEQTEGALVGTLPPGESRECVLRVLPVRRGHYVLRGIRQATVFPFGLWRSYFDHVKEQSLLVYPAFTPLTRLDIEVGRRYQPGGIALTSNLGDSTEFLSTREFRYGDSLRSIHWRSWARTGKPIVKEFQEEFFCRIALVLDTFMASSDEKRRRAEFEAAISLAAAVADNLAREEYVIDIFAAGPELYQLQAGRSLAHFENVMDILACVEPCYETPFEKLEPVFLESLENITTAVVVLLDWDERRERFLQAISERGCGVKAVLVKDAVTPAEAAHIEGSAGAFAWVSRERVAQGVSEL